MQKKINEKIIITIILILWGTFILFEYINNHLFFLKDFFFLFNIIKPLFFLFFFILISFLLGAFFFKFFYLPFLNFQEKFLFKVGLGIGSLGIFILIIGAFKVLKKESIFAFFIIIILFSFLFLKKEIKNFKINNISLLWFFILIFLFFNFIPCFSPSISWDGATYHLTIPKLYLEEGGIHYIPKNIYSNMPILIELIYTFALILDGNILAKLIHYSFGFFIVLGIFTFCKRFFSKEIGNIASFIFIVNPIIAFEMTVEYIELGLAFFSYFSIYIFFLWREYKDKKLLILLGIFTGFALGCKYSAFFILIFISASIISHLWILKNKKEIMVSLFIFLIFSIVVFSPFLIKNLIFTGNPVYPFFYKIFGGRELDPEIVKNYKEFFYSMGMGRDVIDYLKLPYNITIYGKEGYKNFDGIIEPLWLVFLPLIFFTKFNLNLFYIISYVFLSLFFFALTTQQLRFFVACLPFTSILSSYIIFSIIKKFENKFFKFLFYFFIVIFGFFIQTNFILSNLKNNMPVLLGVETKESFLRRTHQPYGIFEYINKNLAQDTKILFVFENKGFFCKRRYLADSIFEVSWIMKLSRESKDLEELSRNLKKLGITHILINRVAEKFFKRENGADLINNFIREKTKFIYSYNYIELYEFK